MTNGRADQAAPRPLQVMAALSWRFLVVAAAVVVVAIVLARLRLVVLPLFAALLLATLLAPAAARLRRHGWPAGLAAAAVEAGALAGLAGAIWLVALPVADDVHRLDLDVRGGIERIGSWLVDGPLGLSRHQVDQSIERGFDQLRANGGVLASGLLSGTVLLIELVAGVLLTLFLLFFFLKDGGRIWGWLVHLFPLRARGDVEQIGNGAWVMLGGYLRGLALVALVDALLIGGGLAIVGVPLVLPLAVLTFLGGFFPIVGANVAGFAAAMVALVGNGVTAALVVVAIVVLVQQLEGHLLQPLIVGRSVRLHPAAILLAITAGAVIWGIPGAFLAVPLTAVLAGTASHLRGRAQPLPPATR